MAKIWKMLIGKENLKPIYRSYGKFLQAQNSSFLYRLNKHFYENHKNQNIGTTTGEYFYRKASSLHCQLGDPKAKRGAPASSPSDKTTSPFTRCWRHSRGAKATSTAIA